MSANVFGVSMHCYDTTSNHDKFYRTFFFPDQGQWVVVSHWGRDGTPGVTSRKVVNNAVSAMNEVGRTRRNKGKKGYRDLGSGWVYVVNPDRDLIRTGMKVADAMKPMVKVNGVETFVIREELDLSDLLALSQ